MNLSSKRSAGIRGEVMVPGDKSISHRAAMLLPLSEGRSEIHNFLLSEDCKYTLRAMRMMGADVTNIGDSIVIKGRGKKGLMSPPASVYLGNSGTSMRLLSGVFAGIKGNTLLYGDSSLTNRPMKRVIDPLSAMGAQIYSLNGAGRPPLYIEGSTLQGTDHQMKISSAQVKSSILLASLFAEGCTRISEKYKTRNHTERMLEFLGCEIKESSRDITFKCGQELCNGVIVIPGDASSAAFLMGAAMVVPNSDLIIKNVLLNPTRTGFIDAALKMGGNIEILDKRTVNNEEVGDLRVKSSELQSITISGEDIPRIIDEIPLLSVIAAFAEGTTVIRDAEDLKNKESNRIRSVAYNLNIMGVSVEEHEDGLSIEGRNFNSMDNLIFDSFGDHRIAMAFALVGLILDSVIIKKCENISTSFPDFLRIMNSIGADMSNS